jgi:hypothetical protein
LDSTPLSQAVTQFNDRIADAVKGNDVPLAEKTVLAAIESGLSQGNIPEHVASVLQDVADSHRLPRNAFLEHEVYYKGSTPGNPPIECFGVSLVFSHDSNGSFRLPVCEIENGFLGE